MFAPPAPPSGATRRLLVETDGGSRGNPGPGGYGAVVRDAATGRLLAERAAYLGVVSNNVAEYTGLVNGLRAAAEIDPGAAVEVRADSRLVVEQMSGRWKIKHAELGRLAEEARRAFDPARVRYTWVPRAQNTAADALANAVMDSRGQIARDHAAGPAVPGEPGVVEAPGRGAASEARVAAAANTPRSSGTPLPRATGAPATLVLVRHGVTALTETGRYSGGDTAGPPLSDLGRAQAARAAALLKRVGDDVWPDLPTPGAVVASPMARARETGTALAGALGVPLRTDERFAECRFGDWDGLTVPEIEAGWPGGLLAWATSADVRPPGGESLRDVGARVARGLRDLADHQGATVALAAHTVVIRAAVGLVARMAPGHWSAVRIPPASLTIVRLWPDVDADGHLVGDLTVVGCPSELA
ncbi:bifunctional RNase H/acid phosphatase [Georgenia thermotolerans]|uniref:Bifunctional RNase H/acid phosphatase n=1 Tax=Georgenia thermotolerans TaxID=527326 RepID=A0A7J5URT5_9MICO|nr:bifunctional RNase H/acid phosphatase [Georgenia thermotolerans]